MTIPGSTILDVMAFVDAGLYPFAQCGGCHELMPMSVDHGYGGVVVAICCRCRSSQQTDLLRFLTATEAGALGWKFELQSERAAN